MTMRDQLIQAARVELQKTMHGHLLSNRLRVAEGFVAGVNAVLQALRVEETDIDHLLPSVTNDPRLITLAAVRRTAL